MAFQNDPDGQPSRPRRRRRWLWIVGGAFAVFLVIGIVGAIAGGGKDDKDAKGGPATVAESPAKSSGTPASKAAEKSKPTARTVLSESGSGIKSTAKFHVDGDWDLRYSYDCSALGFQGNLIVKEGGNPLGELYLNELGKGKSDVTHLHDGGTRFLEVNSTCSWKISVIDVP